MKTLRIILCMIAVVFGIMNSSAEARFFKANSVQIEYVYCYSSFLPDPLPPGWEDMQVSYSRAKMWTGNDTIVDGHSCVTLWDQDEGESPICIGCVREDEDGLVWRYEMVTSKFVDKSEYEKFLEKYNITDRWTFLYDFSRSDWEEGMKIQKWGSTPLEERIKASIIHCWTQTFQTGEVVPVADGVIYGIGNPLWPFEGNRVRKFSIYEAHILNYWRDGVLLIQNPETSIDVMIAPSSSPSIVYDLIGRPADGTQKGILVRNGKKVLVR